MADKNMNAKITVEFDEAASRQSLNSGDSIKTLFGKIKKVISDLKAVAFSGSYNDLTGKPTVLTGGSQTATSAADGGDNVFTFTKSDGTITTITVKNGSKGKQGDKGDAGIRGSAIYWGTGVTGTSTTATVFSGSGVTSALLNDLYLNTSLWNIYQCTVAGAASVAKWVYKGNIKGNPGTNGTNATTTAVVSKTANGLAPKCGGTTTKFLRDDGTWAVPPDTNTTYGLASATSPGLISAAQYIKIQHLLPHTKTDDAGYFAATPFVASSGVMEIGKYVDFHLATDSTTDYDARLQCTSTGNLQVGGNVALDKPGLRNLSSGAAAANATNCPPGAWYGQYD